MMTLYFQNSQSIRRVIAIVENKEDAFREISKFCAARDYKPPYYRSWMEDEEEWYDVGSWSEFFILKEES